MPEKITTRTAYAKKSFGQNFLVDDNYIEKIIGAAAPQAGETIVEIGAGRGALTEKLVAGGASVIAIELERDMNVVLREKFSGDDNFTLVEADALKVDFAALIRQNTPVNAASKVKIVANLPYYISTAILQKLIAQRACFAQMILMFQREVVERIAAEPGNKERGFLSVLVEAYLRADKLFDVPPHAFRPAPKVWSAVVALTPKESNEIDDEELFRELISAGFAQRRKTILNNLKNAPVQLKRKINDAEKLLQTCGIDARRRAETLTIAEWKAILRAFADDGLPAEKTL